MTLPSLLEAVRQATPDERARVWAELARSESNQSDNSAIVIADKGRALGYFFPTTSNSAAPPRLSSEDEAELARRFATPDDLLSTEDLKRLIREGERGPSATK